MRGQTVKTTTKCMRDTVKRDVGFIGELFAGHIANISATIFAMIRSFVLATTSSLNQNRKKNAQN